MSLQYECYEATARSETRELARVRRATRALPRPENMALKAVWKWAPSTSTRKNGGSMANIAHQPGPVRLEGGVSRCLVGVVGLGGGAAPAPTRGAWGASSIRVPFRKTRGTQAVRRGAGRLCAWCLGYLHCPREGQGEQSRCFSQPAGLLKMCKKKPVVCSVHVTRW
jgi:hypothetical protein